MKSLMAKLKTFQPIDYLTIGVVLVALIVSLVAIGSKSGGSGGMEEQIETNRAEIVKLQAKRDALSDDQSNLINSEDAARVLRYATDAGIALANLQTEYQDCLVYRETDTVSVTEKLNKQAESVGAWLTADSQGARVPWFVRSMSDSVSSSAMKWRFMTTYGFTTDTVECLWLCFDARESLTAFTIGTYIVSENKFSDVYTYATQYGNENYKLPDERGSMWADSLESGGEGYVRPDEPTEQPVEQPVTDPDGNPVTPENPVENPVADPNQTQQPEENFSWAQEFENEFLQSKAYREWLLQQKAETGGN